MTTNHEQLRLRQAGDKPWRKWGPYLSERQWGTVREDLSPSGDAWNSVTHEQARSYAYLSGEDGIGGFCDDQMRLCLSVALWNGRDPLLKERLFGVTNGEGNHGEDVKEAYYYLDSTPTHSYAKMLYKYPQRAFPYEEILRVNRQRSRHEFEYELIDTAAFADDRYWDVFIEYAKADAEDILIRVVIENRGPSEETLHVLPHLWFRNTWSEGAGPKPTLTAIDAQRPDRAAIAAVDGELGQLTLHCEAPDELLFTENETNTQRLWGRPNATPFVKDGVHECVVHGQRDAVNPALAGTKVAGHWQITLPPGGRHEVRLRLDRRAPSRDRDPFADFDAVFAERVSEADEFYAWIIPSNLSADAAAIVRQGMGGMLWTKQAYIYDVAQWIKHHGSDGATPRNRQWEHMTAAEIISMPDKWEYPWFAAWDLAFHTVPLAMVDPEFAKGQLELMLRERYLHPNGQVPAYEWNFGDVNPPVHAWATLFNYRLNRDALGDDAVPFLKRMFHKLMLNFTWWVNRKDRDGRNVFEGGFLGLDNIGVFDRSAELPTGGYLEQADGTAWMALFAQNMLDMALELAVQDPTYEDLALKFLEHFIWIATSIDRMGANQSGLWDEEDGFFYDVLQVPGQWSTRLKVRSVVGLLPFCAVTVYSPHVLERLPGFVARARWFAERRPDLMAHVAGAREEGIGGRRMLSLLDERKLRRVLAKLLDPAEFFSDYGIRSLSRHHAENPYSFWAGNQEYKVPYVPAESDTGMFGGNSNWRGPIWMPINAMIVRALLQYYSYYGNDFQVECPTGSGNKMNLFQVAQMLSNRLSGIFLRDAQGRRPLYGGTTKMQDDPHFRDYVLFYEYFHGDNGAGLGASHQTGWTGLVSSLMVLFAKLRPEQLLTAPLGERVRSDRFAGIRPAVEV